MGITPPLPAVPGGDRRFGLEIEAARPMLEGYARRLTRDAERAVDLTQDTLLRAWKHRSRFEPGTNLGAWLATIMRNLFVSGLRRSRHEVAMDDKTAEQLISLPSQAAHLQLAEVAAAWIHLPDRQRQLLSRLVLEGMSCEEVAAVDGIAVGTVKSRASRARALLRRKLTGIAPADAPAGQERPPVELPRQRQAIDIEQARLLRAWRERRADAA